LIPPKSGRFSCDHLKSTVSWGAITQQHFTRWLHLKTKSLETEMAQVDLSPKATSLIKELIKALEALTAAVKKWGMPNERNPAEIALPAHPSHSTATSAHPAPRGWSRGRADDESCQRLEAVFGYRGGLQAVRGSAPDYKIVLWFVLWQMLKQKHSKISLSGSF
jgi:hypothetical protein